MVFFGPFSPSTLGSPAVCRADNGELVTPSLNVNKLSYSRARETPNETVRMPASYVTEMSSVRAPGGSSTDRTNVPLANSERPLDSLVELRWA
jgi:hypothetical protein